MKAINELTAQRFLLKITETNGRDYRTGAALGATFGVCSLGAEDELAASIVADCKLEIIPNNKL